MEVLVSVGISLLCFIGVLVLNSNLWVLSEGKKHMVQADSDAVGEFDAEYIVVLGAGLRPDGTPSDMLIIRKFSNKFSFFSVQKAKNVL